jgi:hypothetical protein
VIDCLSYHFLLVTQLAITWSLKGVADTGLMLKVLMVSVSFIMAGRLLRKDEAIERTAGQGIPYFTVSRESRQSKSEADIMNFFKDYYDLVILSEVHHNLSYKFAKPNTPIQRWRAAPAAATSHYVILYGNTPGV